jgi:hypothetical protein
MKTQICVALVVISTTVGIAGKTMAVPIPKYGYNSVSMRNLVIEYEGRRYIIEATPNEVYNKPRIIMISESKFVYVRRWYLTGIPQPAMIEEAKVNSAPYYRAIKIF